MLGLHKKKNSLPLSAEREKIEREIAITDEKIDEIVYGLYGVTEEEIKTIQDSKFKKAEKDNSRFKKEGRWLSHLKKQMYGKRRESFPTLKSYFALYSQMPLHYFIIVSQTDENDIIELFKCKNECSSENKVTLSIEEDIFYDSNKFSLTYKNNTYNIISYSNSGIDSLLHEKFIEIDIPSEFTILRNLIYREIREELPEILEQLKKELFAVT